VAKWLKTSQIIKALFSFFLFSSMIPSTGWSQAGTNEWEWQWENYFLTTSNQKTVSSLNPSNAVFATPHVENNLDSRLELKWFINDAKVIARPRWTATQKQVEKSNESQSSTLGKLDLTDFFWEQIWSRHWKMTMGLQVYQWGPSELFNASNPFFSFQKDQQNFTFKEKGKALVRFNFSPSQESVWVFILEPVSNREAFILHDKEFKPQWAIKFEKSKRNSRNYWALISGQEHIGNFFVGEYGQFEFKPGHSLILDFKHSQGYAAYKPQEETSGFVDFKLENEDSNNWSHLGIFGYRFEGDVDFRVEFLHNSLGFKKTDWNLTRRSLAQFLNPQYLNNLQKFNRSGLQLFSENYLYASLRVTSPFSWTDTNIYLRILESLSDSSGVTQLEMDVPWGDHFTGFASVSNNHGAKDSEFMLQSIWQYDLGLKYLF
jgi:hypothetical protein